MKFKMLLATAVPFPTTLAPAHDQMVAELDCVAVKTGIDLAYIHRRIPIMAATYVPPAHRDAVNDAMERLLSRIAGAGHLKKDDREAARQIVSKAMGKIRTQPQTLAPDGGARIFAGGGDGTFDEDDEPEARARRGERPDAEANAVTQQA